MTFALMVLACSYTGCTWSQVSTFRSEAVCAVAGLTLDPASTVEFRCQAMAIPLPRPRPASAAR